MGDEAMKKTDADILAEAKARMDAERAQKEAACQAEIATVLQKHNCQMYATCLIEPNGTHLSIVIGVKDAA